MHHYACLFCASSSVTNYLCVSLSVGDELDSPVLDHFELINFAFIK